MVKIRWLAGTAGNSSLLLQQQLNILVLAHCQQLLAVDGEITVLLQKVERFPLPVFDPSVKPCLQLVPHPPVGFPERQGNTNTAAIRTAATFLLAVLLLLLFFHMANEAIREEEMTFDLRVAQWVADIRNPMLTRTMAAVTFLGSMYCILSGNLLMIAYLFLQRKQRAAFVLICMCAMGGLVIWMAKQLFHRVRPAKALLHAELGYSFPSGHSTASVIFFGWLIHLLFRRSTLPRVAKTVIVATASFCCLAVGFSRIYLGVHYATDVLAGFCLGMVYLLLSLKFAGQLF